MFRYGPPALIHVTHWKAGSQWLYKILLGLVRDRIVPPQKGLGVTPFQPGKVYPTVYMTREELESVVPPGCPRFVVIRDLRDTLTSAYYSLKISHRVSKPVIGEIRSVLQARNQEDGLLYLLDEWLPHCSRIQESWLAAGEPLIRYEDLLEQDVEILERVLLDQGGLPVPRQRFREVVRANRFESLTGGRPRGQENPASHERKGISGDWRGHFSPRVKSAFKERYGDLLVMASYERDLSW
jgi:hypothetical protein